MLRAKTGAILPERRSIISAGSPELPTIVKQTGRTPRRRRVQWLSRGQATVEWVLIVSLVVVVIFGLIFIFRHHIFALGTEAWLKIVEWIE